MVGHPCLSRESGSVTAPTKRGAATRVNHVVAQRVYTDDSDNHQIRPGMRARSSTKGLVRPWPTMRSRTRSTAFPTMSSPQRCQTSGRCVARTRFAVNSRGGRRVNRNGSPPGVKRGTHGQEHPRTHPVLSCSPSSAPTAVAVYAAPDTGCRRRARCAAVAAAPRCVVVRSGRATTQHCLSCSTLPPS